MFDVGFAELFLLALIGLLVLGPERLPAVARTLGGFVRKARASWFSLKSSIESELAAADVREPLKAAKSELDSVTRKITRQANEGIAPSDAGDRDEGGHHNEPEAKDDDRQDGRPGD